MIYFFSLATLARLASIPSGIPSVVILAIRHCSTPERATFETYVSTCLLLLLLRQGLQRNHTQKTHHYLKRTQRYKLCEFSRQQGANFRTAWLHVNGGHVCYFSGSISSRYGTTNGWYVMSNRPFASSTCRQFWQLWPLLQARQSPIWDLATGAQFAATV